MLDGLTKEWSALLQVEKRHWLNGIVRDLAANHGMTCEQMLLVKYQIKQRLDYHYARALFAVRKKAYQATFSLDAPTNLGLDLDGGFLFDEHIYDGLLNLYHGSWEFQKHYLGPHRVPVFDGSGEGEEFECAKQIDANPNVDCWLRNVANDMNARSGSDAQMLRCSNRSDAATGFARHEQNRLLTCAGAAALI